MQLQINKNSLRVLIVRSATVSVGNGNSQLQLMIPFDKGIKLFYPQTNLYYFE